MKREFLRKFFLPAGIILLIVLLAPSVPFTPSPCIALGEEMGGDEISRHQRFGVDSIVGGVREIGLLALGITWDAVRIVLPESWPVKYRDIDELITSTGKKGPDK